METPVKFSLLVVSLDSGLTTVTEHENMHDAMHRFVLVTQAVDTIKARIVMLTDGQEIECAVYALNISAPWLR